ncbi:methyltransferase type 11 [Acidiferrobacter sp. SPIII_3]|uniref:methyltransferase domain-containing protein n=1 Tax=Acidiferrobacter sp. SPIII_3 TaxID=1281578 RepID=UPI000D73E91C|nr:methyltransferase domain-containing protein [Acidiferrobacter sp. SPIII_3]AWP24941.1 methyltransferase type 11 [Acidiferrobacter sp. SPIII_3]
MSDNFYRAFEEKYRGPRDLILARLAIYGPFILPLKTIYPAPPAIDLGCGRGEWLEFLLDEACSPLGIDQDEEMLQSCRERSLPAQQGDGVAYLATLPDESQAVVSAFHVVEHLSFDQLRTVVSSALRVLKPGGLLIMETPNPENIVVATCNFWLDPTHLRPIPPQLLSFLPEYYGFVRTKILRLQESKELAANESPTLNDVLRGASPDYAVVAQKAAPNETLVLFDQAFNQEYGLSLNILAERYDGSISARATQAEARATQAEARATQAEARATQAEARATQAEARATALLNSTSSRFTTPLRCLGSVARGLRANPWKSGAKSLIQHAASYIRRRPWLKKASLTLLNWFPGLRSRLFRVVSGATMLPDQPPSGPVVVAHLTPYARQIYANLKTAIERHQKGNS